MSSTSLPRTSTLFLLFAIIGCTDKAKPDFDRCEQLQTDKKYNDAREACERAVAVDPESRAGKLAAARIPVLDTEAVKAMQTERADKARTMAAVEEAEARTNDMKRRFEAAVARVTQLQGELSRATDAPEKAKLEADLAAATKEKAAITTELHGGKPSSGKPCSCPPGDPLCSCL